MTNKQNNNRRNYLYIDFFLIIIIYWHDSFVSLYIYLVKSIWMALIVKYKKVQEYFMDIFCFCKKFWNQIPIVNIIVLAGVTVHFEVQEVYKQADF